MQDSLGTVHAVEKLEPDNARFILGVRQCPDVMNDMEADHLIKVAKVWHDESVQVSWTISTPAPMLTQGSS